MVYNGVKSSLLVFLKGRKSHILTNWTAFLRYFLYITRCASDVIWHFQLAVSVSSQLKVCALTPAPKPGGASMLNVMCEFPGWRVAETIVIEIHRGNAEKE